MSERDMLKLIALLEKALGAQWIDLSEWLRELPENQLAAIEQRVAAGLYTEVVQQMGKAGLQWAANTQAAYVEAGETTAAWLDSQPPLRDKLIHFDTADQRVVQRAAQNKLERVYGFRDEANEITRQITHRAVMESATHGINPRRIAQDFRDSIGLAPVQEQWVANYRRALEAGDYANAMGRQLHDDRSNRKLLRLANEGASLRADEVDTMVERYRESMVAYRAETIARTEAAANAELGHKDAIDQAIRRGDVDADLLEKEWHSRPRSPRAREQHQEMNERRVPYGEDFILPDGTAMAHPHDERGGARHNANCGCTSSVTLGAMPGGSSADDEPAPAAPASASSATPKNPKRQAAARIAAAASAERRREIHSAVKSNLPVELHSTWDKEGHKFMREEADRIRGVKDRINASSTLSQAFAEKYGSGAETVFGNEGDRYHRRAEIEAQHAEDWANEQERRYYARYRETDTDVRLTPTNTDDDAPPF